MTNLEEVNKLCVELRELERSKKIGGCLSPSELVAMQILEDVNAETCLRIAHQAMNEAVKKAIAFSDLNTNMTLPLEALG